MTPALFIQNTQSSTNQHCPTILYDMHYNQVSWMFDLLNEIISQKRCFSSELPTCHLDPAWNSIEVLSVLLSSLVASSPIEHQQSDVGYSLMIGWYVQWLVINQRIWSSTGYIALEFGIKNKSSRNDCKLKTAMMYVSFTSSGKL